MYIASLHFKMEREFNPWIRKVKNEQFDLSLEQSGANIVTLSMSRQQLEALYHVVGGALRATEHTLSA